MREFSTSAQAAGAAYAKSSPASKRNLIGKSTRDGGPHVRSISRSQYSRSSVPDRYWDGRRRPRSRPGSRKRLPGGGNENRDATPRRSAAGPSPPATSVFGSTRRS